MAKLNIDRTRNALQNFDFKGLFIEELGWSNPSNSKAVTETIKEVEIVRKPIAELSGALVFEVSTPEGAIPNPKDRSAIAKEIQKLHYENVIIFVDADRNQSIWHWLKSQDKKILSREHIYVKGQPGDLFISKISSLVFDLSEFDADGNIPIADVASRIKSALDIERVTKKFYGDYQVQHVKFLEFIKGISEERDRQWYASVILNRLMFIYFLQKKLFLDNGSGDYLTEKLNHSQEKLGKNKFYNVFLEKLFFEGFAKTEKERSTETNKLIGKIKYLNGGLFLKHKIELKYDGKIQIEDKAFENLFELFDSYSWTLDDTPGGKDNEINPDVLGYIFEKYINQKAFGAYYTRTEITEYLCEQTVYKLILDEVNEPEIDPEILKKSGLSKSNKRFDTIQDLLLNLDASICKKLLIGEQAVLPNMSLLDPACGSGAFLVAAMKTLINVYAALLGKIDFLGDSKLTEWKKKIQADHPSVNYYIKKQIITNNLYGVDIMEEATEIAKLRLFLALVSSAHSVDQLEPLPNIDFNIMCGNSLIGMMRVDPNQFNKRINKTDQSPKGKVVKESSLFESGVIQGNIFAQEHAKSYQQLINEKEAAISAYKNASNLDADVLADMRDSIRKSEKKAYKILNQLLVEEFTNHGIKHQQITWDDKKEKEGKPDKRPVDINDIQELIPFHWGYDFSEIFKIKNGFDAIITNPPWDIFKPNSKEFFLEYSDIVSKKNMRIEEFGKEKKSLLKDKEIRNAWLDYLSQFPHQSQYFRSAEQYINQISIINGKKAGTDINLYKLFVEQCYNLLKDKGYCGIIIPTGIYTDLGSKQLRELLIHKCAVQELVSFANEKFIFEEVDHRFKFCFLSFEKGAVTKEFKATFRINPRECVALDDLESFLHDKSNFIELTEEFIEKQSPDSLSIMEVRNKTDFSIIDKLLAFPRLGDVVQNSWNFKLGSEFHMTNDSHLFNQINNTLIPLYEGKMMNQFDYFPDFARYGIDKLEGRSSILGKSEDNQSELDYERYRLCLRAISSSTNTRTLIATVLPKNSFAGNSLLVSKEPKDYQDLILACCFLNSFVLDYYIRQVVSQNINMFYIYQLPIPRLTKADRWYDEIIRIGTQLICRSDDFDDLLKEIGQKKSKKVSDEEINSLRARLDAIIANLYSLNEEELERILSTFPVVDQTQKDLVQAKFNDIKALESDPIISKFKLLIKNGESPTVEFKSTMRIDLKGSGKAEKFIENIIIKTISAFLNSDGGTLFIGVEDDKNILGLEPDFGSFSKSDKLDEFQKHLDNLIGKTIGNHAHHYLDIEFPEIDGKMICAVSVKEKSSDPIFIKNDKGNDAFYIRRLASTIELSGGEMLKYCREHWK